jgi:hypothetical protein
VSETEAEHKVAGTTCLGLWEDETVPNLIDQYAGYLKKYLGTLEKELYYSQDLYKRCTDRKRDCEKTQGRSSSTTW